MDYMEAFALVKSMLLASLKGEPVSAASLNRAVLSTEIAIDNAMVQGTPVGELESLKSELLDIRKAVWYANR
jgi:hypothetical protein